MAIEQNHSAGIRGIISHQLPPDAKGLMHVVSDEFVAEVEHFAEKWDREWVRYFDMHEDSGYFANYSTGTYQLPVPAEEFARFTAEDTLTRLIDPDRKHTKVLVFLPGDVLVGKDLFEIGCGVGMLGRLLGDFANSYVGYDYSPLALRIARLTSPERCRYIYAADRQAVAELYNSADTCLSRHFFIHNNFENSVWLLKMLRDVVRDDGLIHADFFRSDGPAHQIFPAKSPLMANFGSCGFFYTDREIYELADLCYLEVEQIERVETPPRVYVNFRRPARS
jgi:SAM-dependent methyltransferase